MSYILYLVDKDWGSGEKPDGGGLQLYPLETDGVPGIPAYAPSKTIPPRWNQMVLFAVQPGRSFHDVQEVRGPAWRGDEGGWRRVLFCFTSLQKNERMTVSWSSAALQCPSWSAFGSDGRFVPGSCLYLCTRGALCGVSFEGVLRSCGEFDVQLQSKNDSQQHLPVLIHQCIEVLRQA